MSLRPGTFRRAVFAALIVVAALAVIVAVAPGYVLRRGLVLRWVNGKPEKLRLSYASARAGAPGSLVVDGLELRGGDPNVEWWFRMEHAEIRYSILDLLARRFHATSVAATGLRFRLRQRLRAGKDTAAARAPLPPIPGLGEVPVKGGPPFYPPPEEPRNYWQVQIDRLESSALEIWIDQYRYEGAARVAGGFSLWPRKKASVDARVDLDGGPVWLGRDRIASRLRGDAAGKISPFDPRTVRGSEVYRYLTGRARVEGEVPDSRFLDWYLRDAPEPRLSGGRGKLAGTLEIRHGEGSLALTLAVSGVRALYRKDTLRGDGVLDLRLSRWNPVEGAGNVRGSSLELADVSATALPERATGARNWWGKFEMGAGTLRSTDGGLELSCHAAARCRDARPLYTLFGVALPKWARGIVAMEGLTASADVLLGPARVRVSRLEARGGSFTIAGDYRKIGKEADGAFLVSDGPLSVGVDVAHGKSRLKLAAARKWFEGRR